jgi:DNA-directed RNA polymerase subunit RPC12/RpoP
MELQSVITCPVCAHKSIETMPADACQYIYDCKRCGHRMKPIKGKLRLLLLRVGPVPSDAERAWLLLVGLLRGA